MDKILAQCNEFENTIFATFLLTGMREEELCFLIWPDVDVSDPNNATVRVSGEGKDGFSPRIMRSELFGSPRIWQPS